MHLVQKKHCMAKSDSFFIRAEVLSDATFQQTSIDLGAYVDALGKSVLRIHGIYVQVTNGTATNDFPGATGGNTAYLQYQLTTQSANGILRATDKSVISTGALTTARTAVDSAATVLSHDNDIMPQMFTNGYLVGVEQIYLGAENNNNFTADPRVAIVLECTVETLSQSAAMALALSQQ